MCPVATCSLPSRFSPQSTICGFVDTAALLLPKDLVHHSLYLIEQLCDRTAMPRLEQRRPTLPHR